VSIAEDFLPTILMSKQRIRPFPGLAAIQAVSIISPVSLPQRPKRSSRGLLRVSSPVTMLSACLCAAPYGPRPFCSLATSHGFAGARLQSPLQNAKTARVWGPRCGSIISRLGRWGRSFSLGHTAGAAVPHDFWLAKGYAGRG
jgi:hypothetical protein